MSERRSSRIDELVEKLVDQPIRDRIGDDDEARADVERLEKELAAARARLERA